MRRWRKSVRGCATIVAVFAGPPPAAACSGPISCDSYVFPVDGGVLPESAGMAWFTRTRDPVEADVVLVEDGGRTIGVTLVPIASPDVWLSGYQVFPVEELSVGTRYSLHYPVMPCRISPTPPSSMVFSVSESSPQPMALGRITVGEVEQNVTFHVLTLRGICSIPIRGSRMEVVLELSPEAEPWRDVLRYRTLVDDEPWTPSESLTVEIAPGASWAGRARDVLYATCPAERIDDTVEWGFDPGTVHRVRFEADFFVGEEEMTISSDEIEVTIDLDCAMQPPSSGVPYDAVPVARAGSLRTEPVDVGGGCRISAARGPAGHELGAIAVLSLIVLRRRRAR